MRFEHLLARRYIKEQKHHSILTICSIIIAISLMTMLFTCYTTYRGIERAGYKEIGNYHLKIYSVTKEQGSQIEKLNQVESCVLNKNPDGETYSCEILFGTYIGEMNEYMEKMKKNLKIDFDRGYEINRSLASLDLIDLDGRYAATCYLALYSIFVIFVAMALRLIIDTSFEISSKERERQFGVLQSIGATPKQIVSIITSEGMLFCCIAVPIGAGLGILLGYAAFRAVLTSGIAEAFFKPEQISRVFHFHVSPLITLLSACIGVVWVFLSAYGTGMRIIKMSPIQAISGRANRIKKVKKHPLLGILFCWTGKLASRNVRRQPKRFAISVLSLTISITLFAGFGVVIDAYEGAMTDQLLSYDYFGQARDDMHVYLCTDTQAERHTIDPQYCIDIEKKLEDSGHFASIEYQGYYHGEIGSEDNWHSVELYFVNEALYDRITRGKPDIPYSEWEKGESGYIINFPEFADGTVMNIKTRKSTLISEEEYRQLAEKQKDKSDPDSQNIFIGTTENIEEEGVESFLYWQWHSTEIEHHIMGNLAVNNESFYKNLGMNEEEIEREKQRYVVIFPYSYFLKVRPMLGDVSMYGISYDCSPIDDAHHDAAVTYLKQMPEVELGWDSYQYRRQITTILSAIRIAAAFMVILLALIAIVNMVNIISTGIMNRKSELASMQCIGMTHGQLYRMIIIECLQFALWAGIASVILCTLTIYGTSTFINDVIGLGDELGSSIVSYTAPLLPILFASIASFITALAASFFPLKAMQKQTLVDQIRSVE